MAKPGGTGNYERIWFQVRRIPRGRVATYGQVASLAGLPGHARQVGYALASLPQGRPVPWQRVLNARGEVSVRAGDTDQGLQRALLEAEGVAFDALGRVDLERFRWQPRVRKARAAKGRAR